MIRRLLCCLLLACLLVAYSIYPAQADDGYPHYAYIPEDPTKQFNSQSTYNGVNAWWWSGQALNWWADPTIRDDVAAVIGDANSGWRGTVPYLFYHEETGESNAFLRFYYRDFSVGENPCPSPPGQPNVTGCHLVKYTYSLFDSDRQAHYMREADIYINSQYTWNQQSKRYAIAHELGHNYGLHERYSYGDCNGSELTIMDGAWLLGGVVQLCDYTLQGPSNLDKYRVDAFWSGGDPRGELRGEQLILGNGDGSWGIYKWQDMAWTELKHRVRFYYWNGSQWVQYQKPLGTPYELETWLYSGAHLYTEPRNIEWQINVMDYPNVPTGTSQNRACTWSWFQASGTFGNDKCSNAVSLTKPPPPP